MTVMKDWSHPPTYSEITKTMKYHRLGVANNIEEIQAEHERPNGECDFSYVAICQRDLAHHEEQLMRSEKVFIARHLNDLDKI